jgi:hypothetical protein
VAVTSRTVTVKIVRDGGMCFIPVAFDPRAAFGKVRAPVRVTLNGYTYRSTIAAMGGTICIPLRRSHREAAGLQGGERLAVRIELDTAPRTVTPPPDLARALRAAPGAWETWQTLSFSHRREFAESVAEARKPETRIRRITAVVRELSGKKGGPRRTGAR